MSDNIRVGLVIAGTIDKSMVRTVAQTGRYGKQLTDTFKKANKQFAATGDVLKYQNQIEKLNRKVVAGTGGTEKLNRTIHDKTLKLRTAEKLMRKYGLSGSIPAPAGRYFLTHGPDSGGATIPSTNPLLETLGEAFRHRGGIPARSSALWWSSPADVAWRARHGP